MSILSTILYRAKKSKKKIALNRLKLKIIFFYIFPQFLRKEFPNKLIASDLLIL